MSIPDFPIQIEALGEDHRDVFREFMSQIDAEFCHCLGLNPALERNPKLHESLVRSRVKADAHEVAAANLSEWRAETFLSILAQSLDFYFAHPFAAVEAA